MDHYMSILLIVFLNFKTKMIVKIKILDKMILKIKLNKQIDLYKRINSFILNFREKIDKKFILYCFSFLKH